MARQSENALDTPVAPSTSAAIAVFLAWIVPGAGHFFMRRTLRGALILMSVLVMFVLGLMMRGPLFQPQSGDALTILIYWGGFLSHIASGALYLMTVAFGYAQPDVAGHVHDYGSKFLVGAGLLNVLAMVDVWEIATGKKS
jgi:hypothetical protein